MYFRLRRRDVFVSVVVIGLYLRCGLIFSDLYEILTDFLCLPYRRLPTIDAEECMSKEKEEGFRDAKSLDLSSSIDSPDPNTGSEAGLKVNVIFTTTEGTLAALQAAAHLTTYLDARIRLIMLQVVSHRLPLERPPVSAEFTAQRIRALSTSAGVETDALLVLCRDERRTLIEFLKPQSLVMLGGRKRRWPTKEQRLARLLKQHGHEVILTDWWRSLGETKKA